MAIQNSSGQASSNRVDIIQAVRTPLGFFSLVVLVVEVILGVTANFSQGIDRTYLIVGMLILIFFLVIIVAAFAFFRPEALSGERADDSTAASLSSGVKTFDRLSDEIEATITNQPQPQDAHPHRFRIERIGKSVVAYQLMQNFSDDHFNQLPPDIKRRIRTYQKSMGALAKEWDSIKREHAISQLDPQVREKQLQLIRGMKDDLVGIIDVLEVAGFWLDDHYETVRDDLRKLAPSKNTSPGGKG